MSAAEDALVAAMARAMCAQSRPNADPDAWTAPERGSMRQRRIWHLFEPMARAALAALAAARPDVAVVLDGEAVAVPRVATAEMVAAPGYEGRDNEMRGIFWLMSAASPYAPPECAP